MNRYILFFIALLLGALPLFSLANGGDQRVVEGKYLINLSRAPFTPRVRVKTSILASFVDIQKDKLITEDLIVKVRIAKLGGGQGKRKFLFEKDNFVVKGGVLELSYTFTDSGLHEVFFDFAFASNPQKIYEAPDFLMDVQPPVIDTKTNPVIRIAEIVFSLIVGVSIGIFFQKKVVAIGK